MTLTTTAASVTAVGNSATTEWPFSFIIPTIDDIVVTLVLLATGDETVLVNGVDYEAIGEHPYGQPDGGYILYPRAGDPLAPGYSITIARVVPITQETDLDNQGTIYPEVIEDEFDYLTMIDQQLQEQLTRAFLAPPGTEFPGNSWQLWLSIVAGASIEVGSTTAFFASRAVAELMDIPLSLSFITTAGYADAGDKGAALYIRSGSSTLGGFQSADGQWWELSVAQTTPQMFGVVADGVTDCCSAMADCMRYGGRISIPTGEYYMPYQGPNIDGVLIDDWITSVAVWCEPGANFSTGGGGLDGSFFIFTVPLDGDGLPADGVSFEWHGGYFDCTAQKNSTSMPFSAAYPPVNPGTSGGADCIDVDGHYDPGSGLQNGVRLARVDGLNVYAGEHWQVAGGDQSIGIGFGIDVVVIENCRIQSARDLGFYGGWYEEPGGPGAGGLLTVRNNYFVNCFGAIGSKRSPRNCDIYGNTIINCVAGIGITGTQDSGTGLGARAGNIHDNYLENVIYGIRLTYVFGCSISNNVIYDLGAFLANGSDVTGTYAPKGIWLEGCEGTQINGVYGNGVEAGFAASNLGLVVLDDVDPGTGTLLTKHTFIKNCISDGYGLGQELSGKADYTQVETSYGLNTTLAGLIFLGTHSSARTTGFVYRDFGSHALTGTLVRTALTSFVILKGNEQLGSESEIEIELSGTCTNVGGGNKTVELDLNGTSLTVSAQVGAAAARWIGIARVRRAPTTAYLFTMQGFTVGSAGTGTSAVVSVVSGTDRTFTVYGTLGNVGDTITLDNIRCKVIG